MSDQEKKQYNKTQAWDEARAISQYLRRKYPDRNGDFIADEYSEAEKAEGNAIVHSAASLRELAENTDIELAQQAWTAVNGEVIAEGQLSGMPHLVEMRYKATENLLREMLNDGRIEQVVELASGLTPHAASLSSGTSLKKYIEVDYQVNTDRKREMNSVLGVPQDKVDYVAGNIFNQETWDEITGKLDRSKPTAVFSEGFMLYTDKEKRRGLFEQIKKLLSQTGGVYIFEDSLRFHPEFHTDPTVSQFLSQLIKGETVSQEELAKEIESAGFQVERVSENVELSSMKNLDQDQQNQAKLLKKRFQLWVLKLNK